MATPIEHHDVVIIGAGASGICVSSVLSKAKIDHVILEKARPFQAWRNRWDSFTVVLPNWIINLPGQEYNGPNPKGFMTRNELIEYLEKYASAFGPPIRENVEVFSVAKDGSSGIFTISTSQGTFSAKKVVACTGTYQRKHRPPGQVDTAILQIDAEGGYHNPSQLPPGKVLVIGSGQSGCQVADELLDAGREVYLSCGKSTWAPRRVGDRDCVECLKDMLETPATAIPPQARGNGSAPVMSGKNGGCDLSVHTLRQKGVHLVGRFLGIEVGLVKFAPDVAANIQWGDTRLVENSKRMQVYAEKQGAVLPSVPMPPPYDGPVLESLSLDGFGAIVYACGYRNEYEKWILIPGILDEFKYPIQKDGESTVAPGLYFVGALFLRKMKSANLAGIGEDAGVIGASIIKALTTA
jgi:putative flavoprotein involved in K+ transport